MNPLFALAGIGVVIGIAVAAGGKKSPSKGPSGPVPKFTRGPGGKGWVFSEAGGGVENFDFASNNLFIAPSCNTVAVGDRFWPEGDFEIQAEEADNLEAVLAIEDNSVLGFVDYLLSQEGLSQPEEIAARIVAEMAPGCADVADPARDWGAGLKLFYEWLMIRLVTYVDEWNNAILAGDLGDDGA